MTVRRVLLVTLLSALAAGCTTESAGDAAPATTRPATDSTSRSSDVTNADDLPTDGAPKVGDPLDTTAFQKDPCRALTPAQSEGLNVGAAGQSNDGPLGKGCEWSNQETRGKTNVVFLDKDPRGLSAEYKVAEKFAYFDELEPIDGYPAIARDGVDDRPRGYCTVVVGVSNEIAFETNLQLSLENVGKKDPCEVAAEVAGMALQTMKQGG
jgi:hypothetical protein